MSTRYNLYAVRGTVTRYLVPVQLYAANHLYPVNGVALDYVVQTLINSVDARLLAVLWDSGGGCEKKSLNLSVDSLPEELQLVLDFAHILIETTFWDKTVKLNRVHFSDSSFVFAWVNGT